MTFQFLSHFRNYFQAACSVPEPEEKFNIDEYSDMVTLSKPVIYISIEEIINTHSVSPCKEEAKSLERATTKSVLFLVRKGARIGSWK